MPLTLPDSIGTPTLGREKLARFAEASESTEVLLSSEYVTPYLNVP